MSSMPPLIGIAGSFASGKDTLAQWLITTYGYKHYSTPEMVRTVAREQRGSVEREVLHEVADRCRHSYGAGYFVQKALEQAGIERSARTIVSGMRSLGEARVVKAVGGLLVFVDAPIEIRYKRMLARHRDRETKRSLEEFAAMEQTEWHGGDGEADFNLGGIKAVSDVVLENGLNLADFLEDARKSLGLPQKEK